LLFNDFILHSNSSFNDVLKQTINILIDFHLMVSVIIYFTKVQLTAKVNQHFGVQYSKFIIRYLIRSWSLPFQDTVQRG